jgi:hypothetical protein
MGPVAISICAVAVPCAGHSAFDADPSFYLGLMMRPGEGPMARLYYMNPSLSTCALTALAVWRLVGLTDPEVAGLYYPDRVGKAVSDVQAVGRRHGAWFPGAPASPLLAGDVWIITDGLGNDPHVGLCVEDEASSNGVTVKTVEGGQTDPRGGSTAIGAFTRRLSYEGAGSGRVCAMGRRHIYGVVRAALLG